MCCHAAACNAICVLAPGPSDTLPLATTTTTLAMWHGQLQCHDTCNVVHAALVHVDGVPHVGGCGCVWVWVWGLCVCVRVCASLCVCVSGCVRVASVCVCGFVPVCVYLVVCGLCVCVLCVGCACCVCVLVVALAQSQSIVSQRVSH